MIFLFITLIEALSLKKPFQEQPAYNKVKHQSSLNLKSQPIQLLCDELENDFKAHKWPDVYCHGARWEIKGFSIQNRPLLVLTAGDPQSKNKTLILSNVHGDEVTPAYVGFKLAQWLLENESILKKNSFVILAPMVNPDGYLSNPKRRTNARGVDLNRNFLTNEWTKSAISLWQTKYQKNPRRYPGKEANSEPETRFQIELIKNYQPAKILSIHSPLNMVDYDPPLGLKHTSKEVTAFLELAQQYIENGHRLAKELGAKTYGQYPGSLGNYAGSLLGLHTITVELPTARAADASRHWQKFQEKFKKTISFEIHVDSNRALSHPSVNVKKQHSALIKKTSTVE